MTDHESTWGASPERKKEYQKKHGSKSKDTKGSGVTTPGSPMPGGPYDDVETNLGSEDSTETRAELYEHAKELDISGRSSMDKDELAAAVEEAEQGQ